MDDPQVLVYIRIAYVAVQVVVLGTYYWVSSQVRGLVGPCISCQILSIYALQIKAKNDTTVLKYGACVSHACVPRLAHTTSPQCSRACQPHGNTIQHSGSTHTLTARASTFPVQGGGQSCRHH